MKTTFLTKILSILTILLIANGNSLAAVNNGNPNKVFKLLKTKYPNMPEIQTPIYINEAQIYEFQLGKNGPIAYTNENVSYVLVGGEILSGSGNSIINITKKRHDINIAQQKQSAEAINNNHLIQPPISDITNTPILNNNNFGELKPTKGAEFWRKNLPFEYSFKTVYGNGENVVALFTDPDCPYCQQQEIVFENSKNNLNLTVYTFLRPLSDIHPQSAQKAAYLWCSKDRNQAFHSWMIYSTTNYTTYRDTEDRWNKWISASGRPANVTCASSEKMLKTNEETANKLGFFSTPTFFFDNTGKLSQTASYEDFQTIFNALKKNPVKPFNGTTEKQ